MATVLVVVVSLLIFLIMREVWCWYWKINTALEELRAIRQLLERAEQKAAPPVQPRVAG